MQKIFVLSAVNAIIVAYFLFFKETQITKISETIFSKMVASPAHLTFVAIILTVIAVIVAKAGVKTKEIRSGVRPDFIPSGQSAIASAILTLIGVNTRNILIFALSTFLALMVLENRIESKKKTYAEIVFGVCMGFLIILLVYGLTIFNR